MASIFKATVTTAAAALLTQQNLVNAQITDAMEIIETIAESPLTCTSSVRLINIQYRLFVTSSGINFGQGSGQQVVTTQGEADSYDSLWSVREGERVEATKQCRTGEPIRCGDIVRFEHNSTGRNLHSHAGFQSPLSGKQEVSGYGDQGDGDSGDDWMIECNKNYAYGDTAEVGDIVTGATVFHLKHSDTDMYLTTEHGYQYNHQNCPRCPIVGHREIHAQKSRNKQSLWKVHSGFFFPKVEETESSYGIDDDLDFYE